MIVCWSDSISGVIVFGSAPLGKGGNCQGLVKTLYAVLHIDTFQRVGGGVKVTSHGVSRNCQEVIFTRYGTCFQVCLISTIMFTRLIIH